MSTVILLDADRRMTRKHAARVFAHLCVAHVAHDDEGLFGRFSHSKMQFAVNDTGERRARSVVRGSPEWKAGLQIVFHVNGEQPEASKADLDRFLECLTPLSPAHFIVSIESSDLYAHRLNDGLFYVNPRPRPRAPRPPDTD